MPTFLRKKREMEETVAAEMEGAAAPAPRRTRQKQARRHSKFKLPSSTFEFQNSKFESRTSNFELETEM
eukprot:6095585-Pyramimonas_sp.AAC.1